MLVSDLLNAINSGFYAMIRYQLSAQKQVFIGLLFLSSAILVGFLKYVFGVSGFLILTADARIEIYLIGVAAALLYMHADWSRLLRGSLLRAPFEGAILAMRFAFIQSLTFTLIYFLLRDLAISRSFLIWFLIIGLPVNAILITWLPSLLRKFFNRSGSVRGILVGKGPIPEEVIRYAERCRHFGVDFYGFFGDSGEQELGFARLGDLADVKEEFFISDSSPKRILFYGSNLEDPECRSALNLCYRLGIRAQVMLHGEFFSGYLLSHVVDGDAHFLTFAEEPLQNPLNRALKRCVDIIISLSIIALILPVLILIVWLVQRIQSPGPIFYKQMRHGLDRDTFSILKFRTMDCTATPESVQATVGDPRIYPLGRLLRHLSLDEIPQFINVLRGEMSVIGPRPHLTVHDDLFEKEISVYRIRHFIKPGITGYAQIRGFRGEVTAPEQIQQRVRHDIYYLSNWSLKLDLYIILKTIATVLRPPDSAV